MQAQSAAYTHIGRRQNNEDAYALHPELGLFVVADGVGGQEGGEIASRLTVDTITEFFARTTADEDATWPFAAGRDRSIEEGRADAAIRLAARTVLEQKVGPLAQMGSTVALLCAKGSQLVVAHVGDSRVYRLRAGVLEALTTDHSLYEDLKAQSGREMPPREEFAFHNVITRAIGMPNVRPELRPLDAQPGDAYLLCTDGLCGVLSEDEIISLLSQGDAKESVQRLVLRSYERGGKDNITAIVVRF